MKTHKKGGVAVMLSPIKASTSIISSTCLPDKSRVGEKRVAEFKFQQNRLELQNNQQKTSLD
jgi:hypothetical protein